jgi:hypothetical protein
MAGRFSVCPSTVGNVPADTPAVNLFSAIAAVHACGRYPIAQDLDKVPVQIPRFAPFDEWLKGQPDEEIIRKAREQRNTSQHSARPLGSEARTPKAFLLKACNKAQAGPNPARAWDEPQMQRFDWALDMC